MCPRADRHTFAQVSEAEQGLPSFCALRSGPRILTIRQSGPLWDCHGIHTGNPETIGRECPAHLTCQPRRRSLFRFSQVMFRPPGPLPGETLPSRELTTSPPAPIGEFTRNQ